MSGLTHLHAEVYRRSGGRFLTRVGGQPVLLLTTTGRRTGEPRTTPVQYVTRGRDYLVVAAARGAPHPPGWAFNLLAQPAAEIQVGAEQMRVRARVADGAERDELWARLCSANHWLPGVQEKAGRELQVFVLTPVDG